MIGLLPIAAAALIQASGGTTPLPAGQAKGADLDGAKPRSRQLSPAGMFDLARTALTAGDVQLAEQVLRVLAKNPEVRIRNEARFRLAQMLTLHARLEEAALLLSEIVAEQPREARPRLELAQLQMRLGDERGARRTLRDAAASPLPPEVARLVDRWSEVLRSRQPFGLSFEVSIAPDTNINRSTRSKTLETVLGDFIIAPDGQAKSGVGLALGLSAHGRHQISSALGLVGRLDSSGDFYRHREYNHVEVGASVGPELTLGKTRIMVETGAGQSWFGGTVYSRHLRLNGSVSHSMTPHTLLSARASGVWIDNRFNSLQDGFATGLVIGLEHALSKSSGLVLAFSADRFRARDPGYSTSAWQTGITGWHDFGPATLFAGTEYGQLKGDKPLLLFPNARSDRTLRLNVGVRARALSVRGMTPFVRLTRERNHSSIAFYDYDRTRTEFGVGRAF